MKWETIRGQTEAVMVIMYMVPGLQKEKTNTSLTALRALILHPFLINSFTNDLQIIHYLSTPIFR